MYWTSITNLGVATHRLHDIRAERDRLIVEARKEGASLRQIARVAGLSHPGVKKIIERAAL